MSFNWKYLLILPLLLVTLAVGMVGGVAVDRLALGAKAPVTAATAEPSGSEPNYALIEEAWTLIDAHYVDREAIDGPTQTYGAINGMMLSLGDIGHSSFLSPQAVKSQDISISGEFEGIGAEVEMRNGYLTIVTPIDDSPAQKAGLKPGDQILAVDGDDMSGKGIDEVIGRVRGPGGTEVTLTIFDPDTGRTKDVKIVRAKIILHAVTWAFVPGTTIAHLRLSAFSGHMTEDLKVALDEINAQGATGIILDMRNNPGGLLDEAVSGTSQFVGSGNALLTQDAQGNQTPYPVQPGGKATEIPMVALINRGTASAAEITSGAIQDAGRATIIGETTFGTGTVLNQFDLSDGSALLLATELWLTPKGRQIWHNGIEPDVAVLLPDDAEMLFPSAHRDMSEADFKKTTDNQLLAALEEIQKAIAASAPVK